jgi:hypothetical protein
MRQAVGRLFVLSIFIVLLSALVGCQGMFGPIGPKEKVMLFNGKDFASWKLYVDDRTIDVHDIWSVRGGVVRCEGKPNGYMRTKAEYKDYRLHLEWRWPGEPTNSGVLLHAKGPDKVAAPVIWSLSAEPVSPLTAGIDKTSKNNSWW